MKLTDLVQKPVLEQPVYEPGKAIEDVARELGLNLSELVQLASNENAFGPSPKAVAAARRALEQAHLYPDGGASALRTKLAAGLGLSARQIVVGNGSNEILEMLGHVFLGPGDETVMGTPAFIVYKLVTLLFGATPVEVPLRGHRHDLEALAAAVGPRTKMVFLPSPNNPTGTSNSAAELTAFARSLPDHVVFVFDEAYAEYLDNPPDLRPLIADGRKLICLRTFSKIYGLAALRVGYGYCGEEMADLLNRVREPFNVNGPAQAAAAAALDDHEFLASCRAGNRAGLRLLETGLERLGVPFVPSEANFLLARVGDGEQVFGELQNLGVIVRPVGLYGLPDYVRITVGTELENHRLLEALAKVLTKRRA
ncbi:MAG: histidinol-phosphate transaminase [Xanthomonadales bacterium]|nr:histidinol-phosphate transaminase [Xanthomonadales bacterium]